MAKQTSFIKLEGTIGDVTFYKGRNGYHARQKGGVSKDRIMTEEKFRRTRENLAEFANAAQASKLLKDVFADITGKVRDARIHNRIYSKALKILRTDPVSNRGERVFQKGDINLLENFQFNFNSLLESTLYAKYQAQSAGGQIQVQFQPFVTDRHVVQPTGATHCRIFLVAAGIDFESGTHDSLMTASSELELSPDPVSGLDLSIPNTAQLGTHRFYALGIEFMQLVNGKYYDLNNQAHNAAKIILIES
jgi:hypothetical protein